jgi:hypothetical protein
MKKKIKIKNKKSRVTVTRKSLEAFKFLPASLDKKKIKNTVILYGNY